MDKSTGHGPLAGKRFFLDPKVERNMAIKLKQSLIRLGGKVEEFLDKGINFALTNELNAGKSQRGSANLDRRNSPTCQSPFGTTCASPSITEAKYTSNTCSKWKDLAKRAGTRAATNNIMDTARNLGIKIRTINEVWHWLQKKVESLGKSDLPVTGVLCRPTEILLKEPCLKVEDMKSKPMYEEFAAFSNLDVTGKGNKCPIINTKAPTTRNKQDKKRNAEQKGFCECCQCSYLNERKHRKSVQHINFGETTSNYDKFDKYLSDNQLDLTAFLKRQIPATPAAGINTDGSSHNVELENRLKEPSAPIDSSESTTTHPVSTGTKGNLTVKKDFRLNSQCDPLTKNNLTASVTADASIVRRRSPRKLVHTKLLLVNTNTPNKNSKETVNLRSCHSSPSPGKRKASSLCFMNEHKEIPTSHRQSPTTRSKTRRHLTQMDPLSWTPVKMTSAQIKHKPVIASSPTISPASKTRKRKRSRPVVADASSPHELSALGTPLSHLRSLNRKLHELTTSADKQTEHIVFESERKFTARSDGCSPTDHLFTLLRTSTHDVLSDSEFLGF